MTLRDFQVKYTEKILEKFDAPAWEPILGRFDNEWIAETAAANKSSRKLFKDQLEYVVGPQFNLFHNLNSRVGIIAAEMGTGKTTMSNYIAYLLYKKEYEPKGKGMRVMFLTSGSKHLNKMRREASEIFGNLANIYTIKLKPRRTKGEITPEEAANMPVEQGKINYFLLSKDTGKNSYKIKAMKEGMKCPSCGNNLGNKKTIGKKDIFQCSCGEKTWQTIGGSRSIGEVYRKIAGPKNNKLFDFLIVDEVHEMQNPSSLQSLMYKSLVRVSFRTLVMTGTLSNGYASSIFHILYPLLAKHFKKYGGFDYNKIGMFVDFFGSKKETSSVKIDSKGSKRRTVKVEELPQINDRIISFLAPYTTWFAIDDLDIDMPDLHEFVRIVDLDQSIKNRFSEWKKRVLEAGRTVKDFNSMHFNASIHYRINNPTFPYIQKIEGEKRYLEYGEEEEEITKTEIEVPFNPLPEDERFNKEKELISILKKEVSEGRRTLVYGVYNNSTGIYQRLQKIIEEEGISVGFLPDNIKSEDIEQWIIDYVGDVLILPQKRVATGLDLVMFHSVIFYELDKQLRIVQQAKVRPWRPVGQEKEVRIYYLAYAGNQEKSLKSMAQKMRAAATVEGKIVDNDSIAAIYDYNPELTEAITEIANNIENGEVESELVRKKSSNLSEFSQFYIEMLEKYSEVEETTEAEITTPEEVLVANNINCNYIKIPEGGGQALFDWDNL